MMVNNSTNINKNNLSPQVIEWWSTIPPISTKITSHFNSLSDGQQFHHQYQQKSPLYSTHWVMVNNSTNINKNHLSLQFIEWWSTIPPISTKITSRLNSLSDGQQFHQYQQKSYLTSTHWVMVNNSTNINKKHLSLQLIEWWSTIPPISTTITSHLNTLSDGQQFHQYQQNHLSPQLIEWRSTIPPISIKITSNLNSLSDGQQFHQYQQKLPLTSTHWVMVNNSTNINKNHLSPNHIEWWSTIPPISTKITSHLNSLSDGQQFHQCQQTSPLTLTHWVMVNNSTNINKNHLSLQLIEWWSTIPPISTKSPLTSIHWVMVNNFTNINQNHISHQLIEWWSTITPISTNITSHFNSLNDGQQFHRYQQKSPLTSTHWMMVNNSTNINKNHLSP